MAFRFQALIFAATSSAAQTAATTWATRLFGSQAVGLMNVTVQSAASPTVTIGNLSGFAPGAPAGTLDSGISGYENFFVTFSLYIPVGNYVNHVGQQVYSDTAVDALAQINAGAQRELNIPNAIVAVNYLSTTAP